MGVRRSGWAKSAMVAGVVAVVLGYAAPPIAAASAAGSAGRGLPGLESPNFAYPTFDEPAAATDSGDAKPAADPATPAADPATPAADDTNAPPSGARAVSSGPVAEDVSNVYDTTRPPGTAAPTGKDPFAGVAIVEDNRGAPAMTSSESNQGHAQTADPADEGYVKHAIEPAAPQDDPAAVTGKSSSRAAPTLRVAAEQTPAVATAEPVAPEPAATNDGSDAADSAASSASDPIAAAPDAAVPEAAAIAPADDSVAGPAAAVTGVTGEPEPTFVSADPAELRLETATPDNASSSPSTVDATVTDAAKIAAAPIPSMPVAAIAAPATASPPAVSPSLLDATGATLSELAAVTVQAMTSGADGTTAGGAPSSPATIDAAATDGGWAGTSDTPQMSATDAPSDPAPTPPGAIPARTAPTSSSSSDDELSGDVDDEPSTSDPGDQDGPLAAEPILLASADGDPGMARGPPSGALSASVWTIDLTDPSSHQISLGVVGTDLVLTVNGITATRALQLVSSVLITGAADHDDTLTLLGPIAVPVTFDGGDGGSDTFALAGMPGTDMTWTIGGPGAGSVGTVAFSGVENLAGATDNQDTFVFEAAGSLTGTVEGGDGGFDTVEVNSGGAGVAASITGPQSGTIARDGNVISYSGMEPVTVAGPRTLVVDAPSDATVVIADYGTPTDKTLSVSFTGAGETHVITAADTVFSITLNLRGATNLVTLNGLDPSFLGHITINGGSGDDTVVVTATSPGNVYVFYGGGGNDTLTGPAGGSDWVVSEEDGGRADHATFHDVDNLVGGAGDDTFTLWGDGGISGQIDGGDGTDTLTGSNADTTWTLTGDGAGTLGVAGASAVTAYTAIENLTGGKAADTFEIKAAGALSGLLDGGPVDTALSAPAVDVLDYTLRGSAVTVDLELASGSGVASFARIAKVVGNAGGGDTLVGPVAILDQTAWRIDGLNSGTVDDVAFEEVRDSDGAGVVERRLRLRIRRERDRRDPRRRRLGGRLRGRVRREPDGIPAGRP